MGEDIRLMKGVRAGVMDEQAATYLTQVHLGLIIGKRTRSNEIAGGKGKSCPAVVPL